jgi:adenylate cyclase
LSLGQFEKSLEFFDKAIRLSPHDPELAGWYSGKATAYFGLKQYDQSIDWARRAIAINPNNNAFAHGRLIAALALSGQEAKAHEALLHYLALPIAGPKTIAAWKALRARFINEHSDPRILELSDRQLDGLRKTGMPEE